MMKSLKFKVEPIDKETLKPLYRKMRLTTFRQLAEDLKARNTPLSVRTITTFFSKRRGSPRTLRILTEYLIAENGTTSGRAFKNKMQTVPESMHSFWLSKFENDVNEISQFLEEKKEPLGPESIRIAIKKKIASPRTIRLLNEYFNQLNTKI